MKNLTWRTKKGEIIAITDLTDNHLINIYNLLRRNNYVFTDIALNCLAYSCSAPDGAAMAAEAEFSLIKFNPQADAIFNEADKRGLEI